MPRPRQLTADQITAAALRLGDRSGPDGMSMRRIAAELGCDPMALYLHFANREALLDAVADAALSSVPDPDPALPWDVRLASTLTAVRAAALQHRGISGHVAARPPLGENGRRIGAAIFGALTDAGLPPDDVVRASQALIAYLAAALAMATRAGEPDARWEQVSAVIGDLPGQMPSESLAATGSAEQFDYGLQLMLDGIRTRA